MDLDESATELNFDPNPVIEERESVEQIYHQKVYLRQLQPPTPQPVEIQVQEVLIPPPPPKSPIHVRVAQAQARTPSPILIKSAPPPPPPSQERDQPIVYNKYIPPPKQAPRQIIIHHYPELPPKPRLSFLSLLLTNMSFSFSLFPFRSNCRRTMAAVQTGSETDHQAFSSSRSSSSRSSSSEHHRVLRQTSCCDRSGTGSSSRGEDRSSDLCTDERCWSTTTPAGSCLSTRTGLFVSDQSNRLANLVYFSSSSFQRFSRKYLTRSSSI